jgi:hypothetical protein
MKKPDHEYYDIIELIARWQEDNIEFTEIDLLKHGSSGKLQFSVWITNAQNTSVEDDSFDDYISIYQTGTNREDFKPELTKIAPGEKRLYRISPQSVNKLLDFSTRSSGYSNQDLMAMRSGGLGNYIKNFELLPDCKGCANNEELCEKKCNVKLQGNVQIQKKDLIVTLDDVKRFEKNELQREDPLPPYMDPTNEYYSVTLDLAVKTWKAIFVDKKCLNNNSATKAGSQYLKSPENGYEDRLKKNNMELSDKLASEIAKIAAGEYSPSKIKWNEFKRNK